MSSMDGRRICVVGSTAASLRAATWLALRGAEVRWLRIGDPVELPGELGAWPLPDPVEVDGLGEGTIVADDDVERAVRFRDRQIRLPLSLSGLAALTGRRGGGDWVATRLEYAIQARLGSRERHPSAREALHRAFGRRLYERVFAPYWRKRWGSDPADLSGSCAAWLHGRPRASRWWVPSEDLDSSLRIIRDAGGDVIDGVHLEGFDVDSGRITAVRTDVGREAVEADVLHDLPPWDLLSVLPAEMVDDSVQRTVRALTASHAVEVEYAAPTDAGPFIEHVVDTGRFAWRICRPGALTGASTERLRATAHLAAGDPLWRADDRALADAMRSSLAGWISQDDHPSFVVRRTPHAVPLASASGQERWEGVRARWDAAGLVGIGARGSHQPMEVGEEDRFLRAWIAGETPALLRRARPETERPKLRTFAAD